MGCTVSINNDPLIDDICDTIKKVKYYEKQSLGSFNRQTILCFGCKKCFQLNENEIKLNCALCNNFFHCNIAGECIGRNCLHIIDETKHRERYCNKCVVPDLNLSDNKCICIDCGKDKKLISKYI
tara:strand:+ start:409 stop:783 length:375 start_codon:yes stop_codon:yes gene_type:complete